MNDEKAIAAAIHAGLQSDHVTDLYSGDCRGCGECGRWTPPGFGHFERYRGGWRVHCVECASGRRLPPEGDQAPQDMRRHVRNMVNDGRYGKRGYR